MTLWIILSTYVVGWYLAAPRITRELPSYGRPHCHGYGRDGVAFNWGTDRHYCKKYCRDGCWRPDPTPRPRLAAAGMALALAWPALLLVADVMRRSQGKPSRHDLTANIARLERELEIGGDQ